MGEAVERLLAALDALDAPGEDMEPYLAGSPGDGCLVDVEADHAGGIADDEPSLGAPERHVPRKGQEAWADGCAPGPWEVDREIDGDEAEPSLGSVERHPHPYYCRADIAGFGSNSQENWSFGARDDTEDEHDGCEPDRDEEPDLGSTTAMNQNHAWAGHREYWGVVDSEPSLGWPEYRRGYGHPEMALGGYDDDREEAVDDGPCDDDERDASGDVDVDPMGDIPGGDRSGLVLAGLA
jgi:hypothetical protein